MRTEHGWVKFSTSTWHQPIPPAASTVRTALIAHVVERILGLGAGRLRVAIDGPTGAGKTTFGHELAERIAQAGRPVARASLDDFKKPWADHLLYDRESPEGYYRNAFDYEAVRRLLLDPWERSGVDSAALCSLDPITQLDHSSVTIEVDPEAVLIVDGVFAFRQEINTYWDFRIWLQIDPELSISRGSPRDVAVGAVDAESLIRDRYLGSEQLYIQEVDPMAVADLVIDNSVIGAPRYVG